MLKCIGRGLARDPKCIKVFIDDGGVSDSVAHEYSAGGERIETYRIIVQRRMPGMVGVMAVRFAASHVRT